MKKSIPAFAFYLLLFTLWCMPHQLVGQHEKADAVYQKLLKEYTLNPDGSVDYRVQKKLSLLTYYSFHRLYGETFILYNPEFQELKINEAYTIMKDGKRVETPSNAFNEVLPRFARNAPYFNGLKEMVVTHTGTEIGATLVLDYTLKCKQGYLPAMWAYEQAVESSPVNDLDIVIRVLRGKKLTYNLLNDDLLPKMARESEWDTWHWHWENLPQYLPEPLQPDGSAFLPTLVFSFGEAGGFLEAFLAQKAFHAAPGGKLRAIAREGGDEAHGGLLKLLSLQAKVIDECNSLNIPLWMYGTRVRTPDEVWESTYGTELELALLLVSLAREAGFPAQPVAVYGKTCPQGQDNPFLWEKILVKVEVKGLGEVILSPLHKNRQSEKYSLTGKMILPLSGGSSPEIVKAATASVEADFELELNAEGEIRGDLKCELEGAANPVYDIWAGRSDIGKYLTGCLRGADVSDFDPGKAGPGESTLRMKVKRTKAAAGKSGYLFLELPALTNGLESIHIPDLVASRRNPLELEFPVEEEYSYTLALPANLHPVGLHPDVKLKNAAGEILFSSRVSSGKVQIHKVIRLEQSGSASEWYDSFRELMNQWRSKSFSELILHPAG